MLSKNKIKYIQSLHHKKQRNEDLLFIAEGEKIVNEILAVAPQLIHSIYATEEWVATQTNLDAIPYEVIEFFELEKISTLQTPNKVLAVVQFLGNDELPNVAKEWVVLLDGIQDPGNLGTIIRICDWFGVKHLICSPNTVDCYNTKVIQASMGSFLRVQVQYTNLIEFVKTQLEVPIFAAVLNGTPIHEVSTLQNGIVIIGNEGKGIDETLLELCTEKITIPAKGVAESLNASVATGIILSHLIK
jgi:RNA methyltransferase, TrmH family